VRTENRMNYFLAIDVGGTKIIASLIHEKDILYTQTAKSDTRDGEAMFASLQRTVEDLLITNNVPESSIDTVGLVIPGQIDFEHERAIFQNNLPWANFPIGKRMRELFPRAHFILKHDVQSAAIGEWSAKGKPGGMFVYVTVSTGLCASMIYRGELLSGKGFAGEIGYMKDEEDRTLEKVASGSAMEKEVQAEYGFSTLKEAFDAWHDGNEEMKNYFSNQAKRIARSLYNVFTVIDPDDLVLGGGVMNHQHAFYHLIIEHFKEFSSHPAQKEWHERISLSTHANMSGIYGLFE